MANKTGAVLFDWGNTLMVEMEEYEGPMVAWPRAAAVPGALVALQALQPKWRLAVASNAEASGEKEIRAALDRVDLGEYFEKIYCFRSIGQRKPSAAFFRFILADLDLPAERVIMVGDSLETDVRGAVRAGLRAVWLNLDSTRLEEGPRWRTIHALEDLPDLLANWTEE